MVILVLYVPTSAFFNVELGRQASVSTLNAVSAFNIDNGNGVIQPYSTLQYLSKVSYQRLSLERETRRIWIETRHVSFLPSALKVAILRIRRLSLQHDPYRIVSISAVDFDFHRHQRCMCTMSVNYKNFLFVSASRKLLAGRLRLAAYSLSVGMASEMFRTDDGCRSNGQRE